MQMCKYFHAVTIAFILAIGAALASSPGHTAKELNLRAFSDYLGKAAILPPPEERLAADQARTAAARRLARHDRPHAFDPGMPITNEKGTGTKTVKQSCWRSGLSRNIGIAEQSCDAFTSTP
jgi:hypothetical protein